MIEIVETEGNVTSSVELDVFSVSEVLGVAVDVTSSVVLVVSCVLDAVDIAVEVETTCEVVSSVTLENTVVDKMFVVDSEFEVIVLCVNWPSEAVVCKISVEVT